MTLKLTRRQFIQRTALTGLSIGTGAALSGCDPLETVIAPPTPVETTDEVPALIIGSGFGGAVAALRLGQAGIQTMLLEQGRRWPIAQMPFSRFIPPDGRSTWLRTKTVMPFGPSFPITKYTGVLDRIDYDNIKVYRGTAVGGGSIVYGGISVAPPENLFYEIFPREISYPAMATYYERVKQILGVSTAPPDIEAQSYYDYVRVFTKHAGAAGLDIAPVEQATDWDIIRSEIAGTVEPSAIIGEVIYGNNSGCKNSLDQNYLPMAEATGYVTIHPLHRVVDISQKSNGKYELTVENIDEGGKVIKTKKITATSLFLAAGAVGTPELLVKARDSGALPHLSETVGQGWGTNGNVMFTRSVKEATGKMQGGPVIKTILDYQNPETPNSIESVFFPIGQDCNCLLHLLLALDTERGEFFYDPGTNTVKLEWPADGNQQAVRAAVDVADRLNTANGGTLGPPESGISAILPDVTSDFTYHPLGGMVIGTACDFHGRVHNYRNLYVIDGSLLPGSCATANPSLTIAALAERNMETILNEDFV